MENKINIAEILKDCPKGMELDCTMFDGSVKVIFDGVDGVSKEPTIIKITAINETNRTEYRLTKYGQWCPILYAKCVIYPKGKTTWEGFVPPCKFKDGDVCYIKTEYHEHIFIFKVNKDYKHIHEYVNLCENYFCAGKYPVCTVDDVKEIRFATKEEKKKLFDAIKEHGYNWNAETKTLEELIEPRFKVGDRIKKKGDTRLTTIKDIRDNYYIITIPDFFDNCYITDKLSFSNQDEYELVPTKFDITTLKPFDKVLVRDTNTQKWTADVFSFFDKTHVYPYVCVGHYTNQCIPYFGNEHLLGTTNDCDEYYKNW